MLVSTHKRFDFLAAFGLSFFFLSTAFIFLTDLHQHENYIYYNFYTFSSKFEFEEGHGFHNKFQKLLAHSAFHTLFSTFRPDTYIIYIIFRDNSKQDRVSVISELKCVGPLSV